MRRTAIILAVTLGLGGGAHAQCVTKTFSTHNVAQVIDGHTVRLDDASEVRLIGALAPETPRWWKGKGAWPPADFTRKELEKLIGSHKVEIRFAGVEEQRDRHDRYLAQLFVRRGDERIWVQGHMIREGLSQAYSLKGHRACARALQEEEFSARNSHRGLWHKDRFKVLQTKITGDISKRQGSFQIVEGTVHTVGKKTKWTFLNFSADWRNDFTVAVRAGDRRKFAGSDVDLAMLEGKMIRVRGWVERWNGPLIKVTHPEQIEILDQAVGAAKRPPH